jgi:excisionase family DNA binding protein
VAEHWLTVKAAAELWGVTPVTIRKWIKSGLIEAVQFTSRCWRIPIVTEDTHGVQGQEAAGRERR